MPKKAFVVYYDLEEQTADFTDAQLGQLMRAVFAYEKRGELVNLSDPVIETAFRFLRVQLRENSEKYERRCEANRENEAKGGRPPKTEQKPK